MQRIYASQKLPKCAHATKQTHDFKVSVLNDQNCHVYNII